MKASTSSALWRFAVVVVALCALTQLTIEWISAPRVLTPGLCAAPLFDGGYLPERGPTTFVVDSVPPDSPLSALGVRPGDRIRFDAPLGRWSTPAAGDRVAMSIVRDGVSRHVEVAATPARSLPPYAWPDYLVGALIRLLAVIIGVIVGWRRADSAAYRALAGAALLGALAYPYSAPARLHLPVLDFLGSAASDLNVPVLAFFALNYPDGRPHGWLARLRQVYRWFFAVAVIATLAYYARLYGGQFEPALRPLVRGCGAVASLVFVAAIVLGWRQSRGESRLRFQWLLATLGVIAVALLLDNLNGWVGLPVRAEAFDLLTSGAVLVAQIGLLYAVFRHRIFDFGLALNRALVFTIVGALLFGVIQLGHAVAGEFLRVDDPNKAAVLSSLLAVTVFLLFHQLKARVEKLVDRLLFSAWTAREVALRRFLLEAQQADDPAALDRLAVAALDRFTGGAGAALFHRDADGRYVRADGASLADLPDHLDANDAWVLAMRAHGEPVDVVAPSSLPLGALALPMQHRGQLRGFILLGAAPRVALYRQDQREALAAAAHELGLNHHALQVEALQHEVERARQSAAVLQAQLDTAMRLAGEKRVVDAPTSGAT